MACVKSVVPWLPPRSRVVRSPVLITCAIVVHFFSIVHSQTNCDIARECEFLSIDESTSVVCYGYRSCQNCSQIAVSDSDSPVLCDGGMSCGFTIGIDLDDKLFCGGTRSCFKTEIDDVNDQLWCHGTASCLESVMEPDDDVYCLVFC